MVSLPMVSSFFSTCGCFLRSGRSPSGDLPPLSLACWWPPGANGSPPVEWRRLLRVEDPSGAGRGGPNRPPEWAGPAGLCWPAQAHLGPVRSPLRSRGSSGDYALCPIHLHDFDDVILASKMEVLRAWSSAFYASIFRGVPRSTSVLATIGSDFIKLTNTKKTLWMLLWTCCESVLYVHVFLHKHNTSKCMHID
jgi:hypothetical protein